MSQESNGMVRKKKTSAIQVPGWLHTAITKYANEHGISQAEAAERVFKVLYPEGALEKPTVPIAPAELSEELEGEAGEGAELEEEELEDVSGELGKTVKDLRTVHTIKALQKGLSEEETEKPLTSRDAFELKKIEKMFAAPNPQQQPVDLVRTLEAFESRVLTQMEKMLAEKESQAKAVEAEFYKKKLEEREAADQRAQEMAELVAPIQEQISQFGKSLETLKSELKPESKTPPTSAELEAIRNLGSNIKEALVEVGKSKGGAESEKLSEYLDALGTIMDKLTEFSKKGETPPGEFDWRTAGISTFGEVATEAIKAYRDIEAGKGEVGEEGEKGEEAPLSRQIIDRRVYNYAMKKIAAGELDLDPYKAAEELGLTANQVWAAVENLRKRGALKAPQVRKTVKQKSEAEVEGEGGEGEIGPLTEA